MSRIYGPSLKIEYSHRNMVSTGFENRIIPEELEEEEIDPKAEKVRRILSDNQWHKTKETVGTKNELSNGIYGRLNIAISDSGRYICIVGPGTPETAPDGT